MLKREKHFPNVDWYCDHCGAYLNDQKGFDDHKYVWKCKECGFKNSISWDSIIPDDSIAVKILLHFVGVISYVSFWTVIILGMPSTSIPLSQSEICWSSASKGRYLLYDQPKSPDRSGTRVMPMRATPPPAISCFMPWDFAYV